VYPCPHHLIVCGDGRPIGRGLKELAWGETSERVRRPGAGRKTTVSKDPTLIRDLEALVEPTTRGDLESPAVDLQERAPTGASAPGAGSRGEPSLAECARFLHQF
jgi:hypothetical protein